MNKIWSDRDQFRLSEPWLVRSETAGDGNDISNLYDRVLGPGRFVRTACRIRENLTCPPLYPFVGLFEKRLVGSVRFTAVTIGGVSGALMLGPLVVDPASARQGVGMALMDAGLVEAKQDGYELVILVGDLDYYCRIGFERIPQGQLALPGPVDPSRLLGLSLCDISLQDILPKFQGLVRPQTEC